MRGALLIIESVHKVGPAARYEVDLVAEDLLAVARKLTRSNNFLL